MSRGDRCIEPPGIVPEQGGKGGEVAAKPVDQHLHRGGGSTNDQGTAGERARGLDQRRAWKGRAGVDSLADAAGDRGEERARQEEGADRAESPHALLQGSVSRVEEPAFVEERQDPQPALAAGEPPALPSGG